MVRTFVYDSNTALLREPSPKDKQVRFCGGKPGGPSVGMVLPLPKTNHTSEFILFARVAILVVIKGNITVTLHAGTISDTTVYFDCGKTFYTAFTCSKGESHTWEPSECKNTLRAVFMKK